MKHLILIAALAACTHSAPTTTLTAKPGSELAARRAELLVWLDEYTKRGQYPTDDQGIPTSVFVDAKGVRCPMAELMFRSGHGDLVDALAAEDNHAQLVAIHDGPVHDWMVGSGLTIDEIEMIQGIPKDMNNFPIFLQGVPLESEIITAQRARVRGRLETAQAALRKDSRRSLERAVAALPDHRLPVIRVQRPVLSKN